ncbi:alcohol dehydrogenase [Ramaria rubella]|nr:alcohol dehydrogenase [Ramaria rubella]
MPSVPNPQIIFQSIPEDYIVPGETTVYDATRTIDLENVDLNGGYLTKTLVISPEPWLRERLRDPRIPSYSPPMRLGYAVVSIGLVKVLRSEDPTVKVGDYMVGAFPWEAYTVHPWEGKQPAQPGQWPAYTYDVDSMPPMVVPKHPALPWPLFMGALGLPGSTAWMGLQEYADMKEGETIYVSTGAGAVGTIVVQLAKMAGLKVIASTGSDHKVKYLEAELGVDHAFNYKTTPVQEALAKHGPIDIFWDNVGGQTLEAAIEHANVRGRILACGYISEYNTTERYGIKNMSWLFKKRLQLHGILLSDLRPKWEAKFMEVVPALLATGKLKSKEHIIHGLENADTALLEMFQGKHLGKTVVVVSEENDD